MRFLISVFVTLFLISCTATGPTYSEKTTGSPAVEPEPGKALVYVYRVNQYKGSGVASPFFDNGEEVGSLNVDGYITLQVDPGPHQFRTDTLAVDEPLTIDVAEGKTYYLEIFVEGLWRMVFNTVLVPEEKALIKIQNMHYQGN